MAYRLKRVHYQVSHRVVRFPFKVLSLTSPTISVHQNQEKHILLQNENGPCPLLAAANCLLLRGSIHLPPECVRNGVASLDNVCNVLADHALLLMDQQEHSFHLNELLTIFPTLQDGMDVNPMFTAGVTGVEYTSNLTAFEMLRIELVHGWLLDPQDEPMVELIGSKTYNQLIEVVIHGKEAASQLETLSKEISELKARSHLIGMEEIDESTLANETAESKDAAPVIAPEEQTHLLQEVKAKEELLQKLSDEATRSSLIDEHFLQSTSHQLTHYGLMELYNHVAPGSLCVFFRNNHFCTLTKHTDGVLYLLVTDLGYATVDEIMWEKLDAIDGDTEYMNSAFASSAVPYDHLPPSASPEILLANQGQNEADFQLALQLARESSPREEQKQFTDKDLLATAAKASLNDTGVGVGVGELYSTDQEEADHLIAMNMQAELDNPNEGASLHLAQQLQEAEYRRAAPSGPNNNNRSRKSTTKSSACMIS
jgi:hypothetical protein